jgi:hypothetical protein
MNTREADPEANLTAAISLLARIAMMGALHRRSPEAAPKLPTQAGEELQHCPVGQSPRKACPCDAGG